MLTIQLYSKNNPPQQIFNMNKRHLLKEMELCTDSEIWPLLILRIHFTGFRGRQTAHLAFTFQNQQWKHQNNK